MSTEIKALIEDIEEKLTVIKDLISQDVEEGQDNNDWAERMNRRRDLLRYVRAQGGVIDTKDEWALIGKEFGFDPRGLGGFFVGNGSMEKVNEKYYITGKGVRQAEAEPYPID